ncbi:aldehyde dehydrogenase family protein [Arsenicicoccus sp. oral taxon 190]|uniref:aldehyde dehydrogenase family protein n=1 Tax=Arsenicicoccus sp. oral taxon 190 TaxID=1658671 RepID=UPI00067A2497|nr:aldehyde dehydrogenase family protein [Arsenicicoccus sp. oral taxon 190]AKT51588.1 benzaldehyde dehydrogenase [Arsenicicoccus sp. oral taxon 190]
MTSSTTAPWERAIWTGSWTDGSGEPSPVTDKATGETLGHVGTASPADLDHAVERARAAQRAWAAQPYPARAAVMLKAAQLLEAEPERLQPWLVREAGSGQGKAAFEVGLVVSELQEAAATASAPYGEVLRSMKPRLSLARYVPYGVVGVISPFNFPAILSMRSVAPALALGNAVVLKPDPRTSVAGGMALAQLLADAGLPEGLLHVLPGGADLGEALVAHPQVPCLSFTGSTAAGRRIGQAAAGLLKQVHLELGGNNALLVLPDADVEAAASAGAWGSFLHQGQICMTAGRHLVPSSLAEDYARLLATKADALTVGDPTDPTNALGPIIDERQRDRVHDIVRRAVDAGARVEAGGTYDGLFYRPTVLTHVARDSVAFTDEIFGPVAPITTYDTVDEAIELLNASEYGLSVGVLTGDAMAAYELSDRIETGMLHINDQTVDDEAVIPFGGIKASGSGGHFGGARASLDSFCHLQWVTMQSRIATYPF